MSHKAIAKAPKNGHAKPPSLKVVKKESQYENYTDTSNNYDMMRIPVGMDIIKSQMKDPKNALVLDCGAGTGNQSFMLCKSVKKIVAFETNGGMCSQMIKKKN